VIHGAQPARLPRRAPQTSKAISRSNQRPKRDGPTDCFGRTVSEAVEITICLLEHKRPAHSVAVEADTGMRVWHLHPKRARRLGMADMGNSLAGCHISRYRQRSFDGLGRQ